MMMVTVQTDRLAGSTPASLASIPHTPVTALSTEEPTPWADLQQRHGGIESSLRIKFRIRHLQHHRPVRTGCGMRSFPLQSHFEAVSSR